MDIKKIDDAKLQEAIANFESIHGAIEEVCPWFIEAIVELTRQELKDEGNFTDRQGVVQGEGSIETEILNKIYESTKYQKGYDRLEDMLFPVVLDDEMDLLTVEIVRAIATQEKPDKINCTGKLLSHLGLGGMPSGGKRYPNFNARN